MGYNKKPLNYDYEIKELKCTYVDTNYLIELKKYTDQIIASAKSSKE